MEKDSKTNGERKLKYKLLHKFFLYGSLALGALAGRDAYEIHKFDKYVIKNIEVAANVPSAGKRSNSTDGLNMETALGEARKNTGVSRLENPAIIFPTPYTSVTTLEEILNKAIEKSHQIQQLQDGFDSGEVPQESPFWIRDTHQKLHPKKFDRMIADRGRLSEADFQGIQLLKEIAGSEYGQRVAYEYEALNSVVAGGTRTKAKNIQERNRSLLDTLEKAGGWRSIIRFQGMDYKSAHAHVFVGYLMANMGDLEKV